MCCVPKPISPLVTHTVIVFKTAYGVATTREFPHFGSTRSFLSFDLQSHLSKTRCLSVNILGASHPEAPRGFSIFEDAEEKTTRPVEEPLRVTLLRSITLADMV